MFRKGILSLLFLSVACSLRAQETHWVNNKGLRGEELVSVAACPNKPNMVLLGTENELYRLDAAQRAWQPVCGAAGSIGRVNQILFDEFLQQVYAATDEGLWLVDATANTCQKIFEKSNENEKNCLAVCVAKNGNLYLGTKGGLFIRSNNQWIKESSFFDDKNIVSLQTDGNRIYVATDSSVYVHDEKTSQWRKILNIYMFAGPQESEETSSDDDNEQTVTPIRHLMVSQQQDGQLYVATSRGVFMSKDKGEIWDRLPLAGLDYVYVRYLLSDHKSKAVYAVAKSGLYVLENSGWALLFAAHDARMAAIRGKDLIVISGNDVFQHVLSKQQSFPIVDEDRLGFLSGFENEPTIRQVQQMAIDYAEVSNEKIQNWRRRAQWKAFLPDLSLDYDKTVTTALGASYDRTQVGPRDWGVSLKWELADFIYSSDQTSIDVRSKLMVDLRNDILSEVTRLYFERRKLQIELAQVQAPTEKGRLDKELRIAELTALIDRLTGGKF
ncbi:MAG: hypothetical protein V1863_04590 [Candidatus Omnitrophota bacterium]